MKRFFSIILAGILLAAMLPHAAVAEQPQSHILDADRVLIYNPLPYDTTGNKLFSGTIVRAEEDPELTGDPVFTPGMHQTGKDLANGSKDMQTHDFWICTDLYTYRYDKRTFRLAAEGAHCCVWVMEGDDPSFTEEQAASMRDQFETVIYPSDTEHFGGFRDLAGDGKLHIVSYAMNSTSVCGFFDSYDLYTKEEIAVIDPDDAESYNFLPIINVNTRMADRQDIVYGTLAHEFQHLILRSAVLASPANADLLGQEITIGAWLNEGFSMAAEEFAYPGSVAEQGYTEAFGRSDKVRYGMSYRNFDATATDVGAYGQSFLFAEYLRTQCGDGVFRSVLDYWRGAETQSALTEAKAVCAELTDAQIESLRLLCNYTDGVQNKLGSEEEALLSAFALAFRIAILLKQESGLFSIGNVDSETPVYEGTGRRIEGGGALLIECGGSFAVPADADSGLIFAAIKDGTVTEIYSVPEPNEGFYVIAAEFDGVWYAIPAVPSEERIIRPIGLTLNADGTVSPKNANGAIFRAVAEDGGFRFVCDDRNGIYALGRTSSTKQTIFVGSDGSVFAWSHFADGGDRLQADGSYGRALLYGEVQGGFGYYAPAYFEHASFAKLRILPVSFLRGDANLDGKVTAADAALVLRTVVGLSYMNAPMRSAGDADDDGEITVADAARILRMVISADY